MKTSAHIPAFALSLLLATPSRADLLANFLNSDEGWTVYNDAGNFDWDGGKGNIPGSIHATDTGQGTYWGFQAGPEFLDDQSEYIGAEMRWQLWVSDVQATDPAISDVPVYFGGPVQVEKIATRHRPPRRGERWQRPSVDASLLPGHSETHCVGHRPAASDK